MIPYSVLPEDLRREVDEALETGRYEADHVELEDAVDADHAYIRVDDDPYEVRVTQTGDGEALELRAVDAARARGPVSVYVTNQDEREHEGTLSLESHGEELLREPFSVSPGERTSVETTDRFGTYTLRVDLETVHPELDAEFPSFRIGAGEFGADVVVAPTEIRFARSIAGRTPCSWYDL